MSSKINSRAALLGVGLVSVLGALVAIPLFVLGDIFPATLIAVTALVICIGVLVLRSRSNRDERDQTGSREYHRRS